ncbi:transposase [endosymbiont of Bathymodiolus septemdierum str. Myojin knoll]|uniref:Transposase n=1 Tax=endosymbiont of Bathymodiolus septemdierum str. Myojin knoll TaxID=1303921 RepID=A0A0P0UQM9_9GAMM|nr:transposase [endosymbiont of Bathymodiolus septemdierum str. Myojin knoll]
MTRKNKYYNRSRLSEAKFREIIKYFSLDLSATQIAHTNLNLNTVNKF